MSRVLKVMIVLLTIAAIATPVIAEDRLGLAGQMRVRGWHIDDDNAGDETNTFADQRLRIGGKLSVAEGVSVTFRTDITEARWGANPGFGSGRSGSTQQWDRAHLDLEKNNMHLRAGQQLIVLGNSGFDAQDNGLAFNLRGALPVTLFYMLNEDNNTAKKDAMWVLDQNEFLADGVTPNPAYGTPILEPAVSAKNGSDAYFAGARIGHGTDLYAANLFVATQNDGMEEAVYVIGATSTFNLDAVKLYVELEYFTGDADDAAGTDAMGLQGYVDASIAVDEAVTLGGQFFYAQGADDDEMQYVVLGNSFNGWDPLFEVGTGLSNEEIGLGRPFDFTGAGAGLIGGRIYGMLKASDVVNLGASVSYLTPEDDGKTDVDSLLGLAGGISYALMDNTKLDLQLEYIDVDAPDTDEVFQAGVGLFVNF